MNSWLVVHMILVALLLVSCAAPTHRTTASLQTETVAGGKCVARVEVDDKGLITKVDTDAPCYVGRGALFVSGPSGRREQLQQNSGRMTFGDETTTCWGPPNPTPAWCVCTRVPCP